MPKATARLPERHQRAETETDAQRGEYTTYAPRGEKCRRCHVPFGSLEVVRRVQPFGVPTGRPYVHIECAEAGDAS